MAKISKIKLNNTFYDIRDTTYQFEQDGDTLKVGVDNGEKSAVYTPHDLQATIQSIAQEYVTKDEYNEYTDMYYGIQWTSENATPTRIGNARLHELLPLQRQMKRCIVLDNGVVRNITFNAPLPGFPLIQNGAVYDDDGTAVNFDGTDGLVMVKIPKYKYKAIKWTTDGITTYQLRLYVQDVINECNTSKEVYIGAFEACSDDASGTSTPKLYSIAPLEIQYSYDHSQSQIAGTPYVAAANAIPEEGFYEDINTVAPFKYRGGSARTTTTADYTISTRVGRPVTNFTRAGFRTRAANRGTGWSLQYWDAYMAMVRLYVVEFCNFNSQAAAPNGLGNGVSTASSSEWNAFNRYDPFVPCGVTLGLGHLTGTIQYRFAAGEFSSAAKTFLIPSYRGIENPFGHIWKWTDGLNAYCDGDTYKTSIYTCNDITKFADDTATNYTLRTSDMYQGSEGYIKTWLWDENGDFIPLKKGGTASSYLYDYSYASNTGWRVLGSSGGANSGATCGLFYFYVYYGSGSANAYIGGRLYYTPEDEEE